MTEKEVIIDDVDVSGCDYIYKNTDCLCGGNETSSVKCNDNADCMYKQLKRLEQENQELGKIIDCKNGTIASLAKIRDELKQEDTKLKKKLARIEKILENNLDLFDVYRWDLGTYLLEIIRGEE